MRIAATRLIEASPAAVWAVVSDPVRLPEWWPGVESVDPGRRGLVPGARWRLEGENRGRYFRRPTVTGMLFVLGVETNRRATFQLTGDRIDVELLLRDVEGGTEAELTIEAPPLIGMRRSFAQTVLRGLERAVTGDQPGS